MKEKFLLIALSEASKSKWPFGAVIVEDGQVVSHAGAGDGKDNPLDPTAHAEVNAIRRACEKIGSDDLEGAILYSSCEPCALCIGAAWYAGIKQIVFGTSIEEINNVNAAWGSSGHLEFPHDHIREIGIDMQGGVLKGEAMKMYLSHPHTVRKSSK